MEDTNISTFNEASFKMKRLHDLQESCNSMRLHPYGQTRRGFRCFKQHFDCLMSLYQEISSKLKDNEKTNKDKSGIRDKILNLKIQVTTLSNHFSVDYPGPDTKWLNDKEGKECKKLVEEGLFEVEETLRSLLDLHGFSTMNVEDDGGDSYN